MIKRVSGLLLLIAILASTSGCGGGSADSGPPPPPPPPAASHINLTSDAGDYIGGGGTYSYTAANSVITVTANGGYVSLNVAGDQSWHGDFQLPSSYTTLQVGTYDGLTRYPFHDPLIGGVSWYGEGRGCNTLTGSITITKATYEAGALSELALQFVQYCEGGSFALQGDIYWNSKDVTKPPGPAVPVPAGLWQPAPGITPATGNFVYLESQAGDYIGAGSNYLYTEPNATLAVTAPGSRLHIDINGGGDNWTGDFQTMNTLSRLTSGYYGNLQRYPFNNPTKGGMSWYGNGRGCNTLTGWFVVDNVTYSGVTLMAIDLRFEQHCEGGGPALHGQIHWASP